MSTPDWTDGTPQLVFEVCGDCAHRWYFRRDCCPACGSRDVRRRVSTGRGAVAAVSTLHTREETYTVCLVDLDDGVRVLGRCEAGLAPGAVVTAEFPQEVPHFVPARG